MALPPIARAASKAGRRGGDLPRLSQDAQIDPNAFGPESIAATIKWRQENPQLAARQDAAGRAGDIEWWQAAIALGAPIAGGALLGGFSGFGAGAAGAAGAGGAGAAGAGAAGAALPWASTVPIQAATAGQVAAGIGLGAAPAAAAGTAAATGAGAAGTAAKGLTGANIGRGLAALSSGRAAGRTAEAANARNYDLVNLTRNRNYFDRANAEVNQREFLQDLQERSYGNSIRASFLQNATPGPQLTVPPEMAQYIPKAGQGIGDIPQARRDEIGGAMYRNAITELLDPLQPGTATSGRRLAALPEPDPLSETPEANWFDSALNYGSMALGAYYGFPQANATNTNGATNTGATTTTNTTPTTTRATETPSTGAQGLRIYDQPNLYPQSSLPSISDFTRSPSPAAPAPREAGLFGDYNRVLDLAPEAGPVPQPYPWPTPKPWPPPPRRVR